MRKKLVFIIFLFSTFAFLSLFVPDDIFADDYRCLPANSPICKNVLGSPPSLICCRESSCHCYEMPLSKWEYCYVDQCCGSGLAWDWHWLIKHCSVADSCISGEYYLRPGICLDSGCAVGGIYKACCSKAQDGSRCTCSGGKNTGTCFYGNCYGPGQTLTCPVSCSCSWVNKGCGQSGCGSGQRLQVYECNISSCSGNGQTRCVNDSSCCSCGGWTARGCGEGSCGSLQRRYTRDCNPNGCQSESKCENDSSCCQCGSWSNGACGAAGGCPLGQRRVTRSCSPSGCETESQCVVDSACACNFSAWTEVGCGQGGCALNRMYQTRTAAFPDCSPLAQCAVTASCASSCTISLSPSPLTAGFGQSTILTASVNPVNATVSRIDFSSDNPVIASVNPASDSDDPYRTYVYGNEMGTATVTATAILSPEGSCSTTVPVTVESVAWFQTQGGDIHAQGSLSDKIPSTATNPNLSLDLNNYPGVISYKPDSQVSFGEGYPSKSTAGNWVASSEYKGKPYGSFDFFKKKYAMQMVEENFDGSLPQADGVYYSKSSKTLSGNWTVPASRWLVILVEGDVRITQDIKVNKGGFLAIASSGKITFAGSVANAQGMFVAETIETGTSATAFAGEGIFAANNFSLGRDFNDARNRTTPAETFVTRPDFLMSSYKNKDENLWWFFQKWQELAP